MACAAQAGETTCGVRGGEAWWNLAVPVVAVELTLGGSLIQKRLFFPAEAWRQEGAVPGPLTQALQASVTFCLGQPGTADVGAPETASECRR